MIYINYSHLRPVYCFKPNMLKYWNKYKLFYDYGTRTYAAHIGLWRSGDTLDIIGTKTKYEILNTCCLKDCIEILKLSIKGRRFSG